MKDYWRQMDKKNVDYFYEKPQPYIPTLAKIMKKKKMRRVLDVGFGYGRNFVYLARKGFSIYGFDNSKIALEAMRKRLSNERLKGKLVLHDMNKRFPYADGFFDAVISVSVMHHSTYDKVKKISSELDRVLRKGGILFITAPNEKSQAKRFKRIAYRTFIPLDGKEKGVPHFYFSTPIVKRLFKNYRLKISLIRHRNELNYRKVSKRYQIYGIKQ